MDGESKIVAAAPSLAGFAVLCDLDGTMVDSDGAHFLCFNRILQRFGRSITMEQFQTQIHGRQNLQIRDVLFPDMPMSEFDELTEEKEAMFRDMLAANLAGQVITSADGEPVRAVAPIKGAVEFVQLLHKLRVERCLGTACVTNAPRLNALAMLAVLGCHVARPCGLSACTEEPAAEGVPPLKGVNPCACPCGAAGGFQYLVLGDECERGKPFPDPYLTALKAVGSTPDKAIVFEDSRSGIAAAVAAHVKVIVGVASTLTPEQLLSAGCTHAVHHLSDITADTIQEWLGSA